MKKTKLRRCVRVADGYLKMAQYARRIGRHNLSIDYSIKANKFYNIVHVFNLNVLMIITAFTAIMQIIILITEISK